MLKINLEELFMTNQSNKQYLQTQTHSRNDSLSNSFSHPLENQEPNCQIYVRDDQLYEAVCNQPSLCNKRTSYGSSKLLPGSRLYYQSLNDQQRKKYSKQYSRKEVLLIKQQKQQKEKLIVTATPSINPKSIQIVQRKNKNINQNSQYRKTQKQVIKPTIQQIQEQQIKKCTFKPQLISKPLTHTKQRVGQSIFQELYNDHKIRQLKKQLATKQSKHFDTSNKSSNHSFDQFMQRNQQFLQKINRKKFILQTVTKYYDLQTGEKLFQPKILKKQKTITQQSLPQKLFFHDSIEQVSQQQNQQNSQYENKSSIFNKFNQLQLDQQWMGTIDFQKQLFNNVAINDNKILEKSYQQSSIKNQEIQQPYFTNEEAQISFS